MTKKDNKSLYFVALVPPEPIFSEVEKIKGGISARFNTKASLKSPPHITLHMPFSYAAEHEHKIISALSQIDFNSFQVDHQGFGAFPPRVIYIQVAPSAALTDLHLLVTRMIRKELKIIKETYRNEGFKPHMTVAFRDLRPAKFKEAWDSVNSTSLSLTWEVKSFFLLKHNGSNWTLLKEFEFS